ncbi:MAG: YdiU family protein [Candidatus Poseidoniales archaeon]|mgnify:CR=1 FL=1|nr:MAG: YdiU family protein [Candidatus Poseidoniales archaeon]
MGTFESLEWVKRFLDETPGDLEVGGVSRQVPNACWSRVNPTIPPDPKLMLWSEEMASILSLNRPDGIILGGGKVIEGMDPYAQRYGGHQFGNWANQLGDGRAITLGEVKLENEVLELQLKGSGITPYSRFADGKAVLRSSIREFLCSEAMHHLGVPTTRALSLVTTGEKVLRDMMYDGNPALEIGAVVCRVAPSFIRFGSFQIHTANQDYTTLKILVEHTVRTHFPEHSVSTDEEIVKWLTHIAEQTATMISHWMRVGFVHGVMNTDNMSIHGLTIDYGPYGWLEDYNPGWTPNTTDAATRRYRYGQQPKIGAWNLARLFESMVPLMDEPSLLHEALSNYSEVFAERQNQMWVGKLGLGEFIESDESLIVELNALLQEVETDMTIFFRQLCSIEEPEINFLTDAFYDPNNIPTELWNQWLSKWWKRVDGTPNRKEMLNSNPKYVLRNWMAQLAIDAAESGDFSICEELYHLLKKPYEEQKEFEEKWFKKRPEWARHRVGCSMLSCSS